MSNIKINKKEWEQVSEGDKETILKILRESLLEDDDVILPDANAPQTAQSIPIPGKERLCKIGCGVAEAAAIAACSTISGGVGTAVCIALAEAAALQCREACE
jgi:hypothetical protein